MVFDGVACPARSSLLAALALAALVVAPGAPAGAQTPWDTPGQEGFDPHVRSGGSVELGFWTAGQDGIFGDTRVNAVSGLLRVAVVIDDLVEIGAVAGWAWGELDVGSLSLIDAASAANPFVYGAVVVGDEAWRLRVGGGIALPVAPNDDEAAIAAYYGAAIRGLSELWLWAPSRLSLVPQATIEAVPVEFLYLEGGLRAGVIFPVSDDTISPCSLGTSCGRGDVELAIDAHAAVGLRHDNILGGVRFRVVFLPTIEEDQAQSSMELFVRGTGRAPDAELFGEWRLTMNLDEELGFAFDELKVWGMFLAFGAGV